VPQKRKSRKRKNSAKTTEKLPSVTTAAGEHPTSGQYQRISQTGLPDRKPQMWRLIIAMVVMVVSGSAFAWVEFYQGPIVTPVIRSFSILSDCSSSEGFVGLLVKSGPAAELTIGLTGPISCSHIRFQVPTVIGDISSLAPGGGRQVIPVDAVRVVIDQFKGTIIDLYPDKLEKLSPFISFPIILERKSFDTYSLRLPINLEVSDGGLHSPKSIQFSSLINSEFNVAILRPTNTNVREHLEGQHMVAVNVDNNGEIALDLQNTQLKGIKNLVQWTSAAFFGGAVAFLLGFIGLRF
jgi:hypothetical protein